ncbi:PLP-dependent aminotransferase family protein [Microtetraspora sp. NBRC 13810]|uniref:MocR-like pyridoxine biosynthesis transcription factor PdxR n=1 Tax=Microtetraspora sp. NBRC 13810 TaxID=3030990 RepID=UPI002555A620|nr:PLP-dependent aminotransferase family protein [Microtetraspora sp. NBRC 13810]
MRDLQVTTSGPELPLTLVRDASPSLATQLGDQLRAAMRAGVLSAGERLPSTRGLARQLGVSRTVVTEAYQQLYAEGWLDGRHGSGTYVADLPEIVRPAPATAPAPPRRLRRDPARHAGKVVDLRPGSPWTLDYDRAAWRRALRRAADHPLSPDPDPYGLPELREALAVHLRRTRAVPVDAEGMIVTRGTGNGLGLVTAALLGPGDRAGVEDPGYRVARNTFRAHGAEVVSCPVDEDGVIVEGLPGDLRVLYTTPAHQYPTGGRLPIPRRERLLAWARRTGAIVIEDDYDAEFRYDVAPLPALYGLDPDRVVLLGTLSKSLAPDVGVGWLLARPDLLARFAETRSETGDRTPGPVQAAVTALLDHGDLDRHLRRMRLEYARRRAVVVELLGPLVRGDTAGLHVMIELPEHVVRPLAEAARERGVLLDTAERHHNGAPRRHGIVLGYGSASLQDVRRGCEIVARLAAELAGAPVPREGRGGRRADPPAARAAPTSGPRAEPARAR